jgi:hypothetical protein
MFRAIFCPSSGAWDCDLQQCGVLSNVLVGWRCEGCGSVSNIPHTEHTVYAAATTDLQPTKTLDNSPHCCKSQSYAPEDGQKIARNMLSWFQRSIKLLFVHLVGHLYYSPTVYILYEFDDGRNIFVFQSVFTTSEIRQYQEISKQKFLPFLNMNKCGITWLTTVNNILYTKRNYHNL